MTKPALFEMTLGKLGQRFPSRLDLPKTFSVENWDWDDESSLIDILQDFIDRCSDTLKGYYAQEINDLYSKEHGLDAGVGMANASLQLHCQAVIQALELIDSPLKT